MCHEFWREDQARREALERARKETRELIDKAKAGKAPAKEPAPAAREEEGEALPA